MNWLTAIFARFMVFCLRFEFDVGRHSGMNHQSLMNLSRMISEWEGIYLRATIGDGY